MDWKYLPEAYSINFFEAVNGFWDESIVWIIRSFTGADSGRVLTQDPPAPTWHQLGFITLALIRTVGSAASCKLAVL